MKLVEVKLPVPCCELAVTEYVLIWLIVRNSPPVWRINDDIVKVIVSGTHSNIF
jgi:hypothetical protein